MYEVMIAWETAHTLADQPPFIQDFAEMWQTADKIVYSKALLDGSQRQDAPRARLRPGSDPEHESDGGT
jgi:hypothetical protein